MAPGETPYQCYERVQPRSVHSPTGQFYFTWGREQRRCDLVFAFCGLWDSPCSRLSNRADSKLRNIVSGVFTPVLAKHTKSFNLVDTRSVGVDRIQWNFEPQYPEFSPRTMWSLSNAFTSAFKALDPVPRFKATAKLGEFLT